MRPRYITDPQTFDAAVQLGVTRENACLEFKQQLNLGGTTLPEDQRIKKRLEFCRDVSQFANTDGGCILIGISEMTDPSTGISTAQDVIGLTEIETLHQQIEEVLALYLVPSTFRREFVTIALPGKGTILAINVPPSERPVVVWNYRERWLQCFRRTDRGKVALNPNEFEALLMDSARSIRMRLDRLLEAPHSAIAIHSGVWAENQQYDRKEWDEQIPVRLLKDYTASAGALGESEFSIVLALPPGKTFTINIPYGFVEEIWMSEARIVTISLTRKLFLSLDGRLSLERRAQ